MAYIDEDDLTPFATIDPCKGEAMIADATAQAILVAPCLGNDVDLNVDDEDATLDAHQRAAVKSVLRGAILRWNDSGNGALTQQQAGPFGVTYDNRQARRSLFWPSEIESLQDICSTINGGSSGAFSIDTVGTTIVHADVCSINFGATYCSCGAVLAGYPIWEVAE